MNLRTCFRRGLVAVALLAWAFCGVAQARIFWVGSPPCQYQNLGEAVVAARVHVGDAGGDVIRVTSESWTTQAIAISEVENLVIEGGWPRGCNPNGVREPFHSVFEGTGGAQAPVFSIYAPQGVNVTLDWLRIERGDAYTGLGGGVNFWGDGVLRLINTKVANNQARAGGGIYAKGTGSHAELILGAGTVVERNRAGDSGGGVYAESLEMTMEGNSIIRSNTAAGEGANTGYGGGLKVLGNDFPGIAYIRSTGDPTRGTIHDNNALYGGGIAVEQRRAGGSRQAFVELYTTDPSRPVVIRGNRASAQGGGFHLESNCGECYARIHAWDLNIIGNRATAGAAVYSSQSGGSFWLNDVDAAYDVSRPRPTGSVRCHSAAQCSRIDDNLSVDASGTPTTGAALQLPGGSVRAQAFYARNNRGGRWLDGMLVKLRTALITGNQATFELLKTTSYTVIHDVTIANNTIGASRVMSFDEESSGGTHHIYLRRSIVWQPGKTTLTHIPSRGVVAEYVLSAELGSLGNGNTLTSEPPRFIDPESGVYRVQPGSIALDFSPYFDSIDIDGKPRSVDLPDIPDTVGPTDLGPWERQTLLPLLYNGQFDTSLEAWREITPGTTRWDAQQAARVEGIPSGGLVHGRRQCLYLPGPGTYRLGGRGRTEIEASQASGDQVWLRWEFRKDGGTDACTAGVPTTFGTVFLGDTAQWHQADAPAVIDVPPNQFTHNSTITVEWFVFDRGSGRAIGWFDDIVLDYGDDTLFRNGFD